jgi:2-iminoacetate synthase ThiH
MVKLSEKTKERVNFASAFLGMSTVETMRALIEIGLSVIENKYEGVNDAKKSKEMCLQGKRNASVSYQGK